MVLELSIETAGAPEGLQDMMAEVAGDLCAGEGVAKAAAYARLVDDAQIRAINRDQRGVDAATDVLSFPAVAYPAGRTARDEARRVRREYDPEIDACFLGDFVISLPRARAQAEEYGHSLLRELGYLTAHAILHLLGYDHETDWQREAMREREEAALRRAGLARQLLTDRELYLRACEALKSAYAPYSRFKVGACLLASDGRAFCGCNVENASYGATICAERAAVACAVSQGARRFTAIAVVGEQADAWPCGVCRQVLNEFSQDMRVLCGSVQSGKFASVPLADLLPRSFGPEDLGKSC